MAPAHKGAPQFTPKEDDGHFGVFVNIHVPQLRIELREPILPPHQSSASGNSTDASIQLWPGLHLEVSHPTSHAHLTGSRTRVTQDQDGLYAINFSQKFRTDPTMDALHELLNNPITLELHDSSSAALLATATLDLMAFALGESSFAVDNLLMRIDAATAEAAEAAAAAAAARPASQNKRAPNSGRGSRNPGPPTLPRFATPPELSGLQVFLTHRQVPQGSSTETLIAAAGIAVSPLSGTRSSDAGAVAGRAGGVPKGSKSGAKAAEQQEVVIDESLLPPLEPFIYLPDGVTDPSQLNVLELRIQGPSENLPPGLIGAHDAAGGRLSFMAGLALPSPCPSIVLQGGALHKDEGEGGRAHIVWPGGGRLRHVMKPDAVQAVLGYLDNEGELCVELARYMEPDKALLGDTEVAWNAYHARAHLSEADVLLEGGTTQIGQDGVTKMKLVSWESGEPHATTLPSTLPAYNPLPGKFKPIEDILPGRASTPSNDRRPAKQDRLFLIDDTATGKGAAPSQPPPFSAWEASGTTMGVGLRFARTLLPVWEPPAAPVKKLQDFIPQRDLNPPPPPVTCDDEFKAQVTSILKQLAAAYLEANGKDQAKPVNPAATPLETNKKLIKSLNKTGQYMAMRDGLKAVVVRMAQERFLLSGNMSPNEMSETYGPLYTHLCGIAHSVVNKFADDSPAPLPVPEPAPPPDEMASLAARALEAEAVGDNRRCAALMRRRLLDTNNAQVHVEAAALAARAGDHAYALSLLHIAIEINPSHQHALAAASMLHLDAALAAAVAPEIAADGVGSIASEPVQGFADPEVDSCGDAYTHWHAALACADALMIATQGSSDAWAALALVHKNSSVTGCSTENSEGQPEMYVGLGGAGDYGRCITEIKRRVRNAHKTLQRSNSLDHGCGADREHEAEAQQAPDVSVPAVPAGSAGVQLSPVSSAGVLSVWHLLLDLGLRGLAEQARDLATGVFMRSSSMEPMALALAQARTHMLPHQPHFRQHERSRMKQQQQQARADDNAGAGDGQQGAAPLENDGEDAAENDGAGGHSRDNEQGDVQQQSFKDPQQTCFANSELGGDERQSWGDFEQIKQDSQEERQQVPTAAQEALPSITEALDSTDQADEQWSDCDFKAAMSALRTASRMAEAATALNSRSNGLQQQEDTRWTQDSTVTVEGGLEREEEETCLDIRPLLLMGDLLWTAAGQHEPTGASNDSFSEYRRDARMVYQRILEIVNAASEKGIKYSPDGYSHPASGTLTKAATQPAAAAGAAASKGGVGSGTEVGRVGVQPWALVRAHLRLSQSFLEDELKAQCMMDVCAAAAAAWPTCTSAWKGAAVAAGALGDIATARVAWSEANVLDTEDGQTWAALAAIDLREGRKREAVAAMDKALSLTAAVAVAPLTSTACPAEDAGKLLVEAATAASTVGDLYDANVWLQRALDAGHHTFEVYQQLAIVQVGRKDLLGARASVQAASKLAQSADELECLAALQQSTSLEFRMQQCALDISS